MSLVKAEIYKCHPYYCASTTLRIGVFPIRINRHFTIIRISHQSHRIWVFQRRIDGVAATDFHVFQTVPLFSLIWISTVNIRLNACNLPFDTRQYFHVHHQSVFSIHNLTHIFPQLYTPHRVHTDTRKCTPKLNQLWLWTDVMLLVRSSICEKVENWVKMLLLNFKCSRSAFFKKKHVHFIFQFSRTKNSRQPVEWLPIDWTILGNWVIFNAKLHFKVLLVRRTAIEK